MNLNRKKKGFTIVELVIVVAVIAVLAAILIPTFVGLVNKANVAADGTLVRELNNALALDLAERGETKYETMTDALEATERYGFDVAKIDAKASKNKILWDSENGVFCYLQENAEKVEYVPNSVKDEKKLSADDYRLWIISNTVDETYSTYLYNYTGSKSFTFTHGLDVGKTEGLETLSYTGVGSKQDVVIRTNGGTLTINGYVDENDPTKGDTVQHYDDVDNLTITAVASSSFHEFGTVEGNITIAKGRLVVEESATVSAIVVTATSTSDVSVEIENEGAISVAATNSTVAAALNDVVSGESAVVSTEAVNEEVLSKFFGGLGTELSPYLFSNETELLNIYTVNKTSTPTDTVYYKAVADIEDSGAARTVQGYKYKIPYLFNAEIDFDGHTLYEASECRLVYYATDAAIRNVTIVTQVDYLTPLIYLGDGVITFDNVNMGNEATLTQVPINHNANNGGGLIAFVRAACSELNFVNCRNYYNHQSYNAGVGIGIFVGGYFYADNSSLTTAVTFDGCANYASVVADNVGFITGNGQKMNYVTLSISNSVNTGRLLGFSTGGLIARATSTSNTAAYALNSSYTSSISGLAENTVIGSSDSIGLSLVDGKYVISESSLSSVATYGLSYVAYPSTGDGTLQLVVNISLGSLEFTDGVCSTDVAPYTIMDYETYNDANSTDIEPSEKLDGTGHYYYQVIDNTIVIKAVNANTSVTINTSSADAYVTCYDENGSLLNMKIAS